MAFSLTKSTGSKKAVTTDVWKFEHIVGNSFVTFVLDNPIRPASEDDRQILLYLQKIIEKAGIYSYVITTAIPETPTEKEIKKEGGLMKYYTKHDSNWFNAIIKPAREKGMTAEVIVPFGPVLYQIIKTATDFTVEDLIFPFLENYFYLGHGYVGDYDSFIFPQFSIDQIFRPGKSENKPQIELGAWRMNFMVSVLRKIAKCEYAYPENMNHPELKEIAGYENVRKFLLDHFHSEICAFDLETSGFDFIDDIIRCITLAFDEDTGYYIEWKEFTDHPDLVQLLSEMLLSCKVRTTVNGKFDIKFLWQNGLSREVQITDDAMLMQHVLCSERKKGLKTQTYWYTPWGGYDYALDEYRERTGNDDYSIIPKKILFPYATMDAVMTVRIHNAVKKRLHDFAERFPSEKPADSTGGRVWTPYDWYHTYVMGLYPKVCEMEFEGICVDEEVMDKHRAILKDIIEKTRDELADIFTNKYGVHITRDYPFGSQTKLGALLRKAGWPCHGISQEGEYATSDVEFTEWERDGMEGMEQLRTFRTASTCYGTYIGTMEKVVDQRRGTIKEKATGWLQYVKRHPDGTLRMHCNFGVCTNTTFRCRSSEPNLQNIPTRGKLANMVKQCITTPVASMYYVTGDSGKEYKLTEIDYIRVKNHPSGQEYIEARFLTENDTIDESDPELVVKEYD